MLGSLSGQLLNGSATHQATAITPENKRFSPANRVIFVTFVNFGPAARPSIAARAPAL
jgi:hypothetical protein